MIPLNIIPEVFRVNIDGDSYKTAGDPFLESTATEQMKENYGQLLNNIYSIFVKESQMEDLGQKIKQKISLIMVHIQ